MNCSLLFKNSLKYIYNKNLFFKYREDIIELQKIEFFTGKKLPVFQTFAEELEPLTDKVKEAQVFAKKVSYDLIMSKVYI